MTEDWRSGGFGLYLHWPFCEAKCPYCDFNSHVRKDVDQSRWLSAYIHEIDKYAKLVPNRILNSVFIGGGTPSLMQPDLVAAILERIRGSWTPSNDFEVTLEANPSSVEAGRFADYAHAGVNRVSLGVQSLRDNDLRRLGRLHDVSQALQAFDIARKFFSRVSFDLIYARQDQTIDDWRTELSEALSLAIDHLSLYQLTIEPGTVFSQRHFRGGLRGLPSEDMSADLYNLTQDLCASAGFLGYEVSNHAKSGAESRHNLIYWRYGDYVGIGPGAHGRLTIDGSRYETEAWSNPEKWLVLAKQDNAAKIFRKIERQDQATEYLLMSLRLQEGLDLRRYQALAQEPLGKEKIEELVHLNLLTEERNRISTTREGRLVLNSVIQALMNA